jgi:hypothetical protein
MAMLPDLADRSARLDRFVNALISAFPDDVRAVYVVGSHANNTAIASSDIDLFVVARDLNHTPMVETFVKQRQAPLPFALDVVCVAESLLTDDHHAHFAAALKWNSRLLTGTGVALEHLDPSLAGFQARAAEHAVRGIARLRGRAEVSPPVGYPDPGGEFFGYDTERRQSGYPAATTQGTTDMIATASWSASAFIARSAGAIAASRADAFSMYPNVVRDEWSTLLAAIYERCRLAWGGEVPASPDARSALRKLCARFLLFENHVLEVFAP